MIRLATLSIRRPRAALAVWVAIALALSLIGLGISGSLSPSISVVPGSESSRAQDLSESEFGPSVLVPILLEGPAGQLDRQGPKLVLALGRRADTRVMSAWSTGAVGRSLRPAPDAAMVVASVARTEDAMVNGVQADIERTVGDTVAAPVNAYITGQPTLDLAVRDEALDTTRAGLAIALGILFVLLLAGLRAPLAALAVTGLAAGTTFSGFGVMTLVGKVIETDAVAVALAAITGLALGAGFALLILDRYHETARSGAVPDPVGAATQAVASGGRVVLWSGTATIVALVLAVAIAPTTILMSLGIGVLLCAMLATGAAVVVLPALLVLLGTRMEAFALPAPRFLARGWDWVAGRGRWVTRWAVVAGAIATAALIALALPARTLDAGPPDITMLPASDPARQDFERVATVMGPGWPTPFNVVLVSDARAITDPQLLRDVRAFQREIAHDPRVDSVVGPGAFVAQSRELKALPAGLEDSAKLLKGGKKDLGRLQRGLGKAGSGATQLQQGLGSAAAGAGQLESGAGAAGSGAGQLRAGLVQARAGAAKISGGLDEALTGANALKQGAADALAGSGKLAGGLGQAVTPVKQGLPVFQSLASDVASASSAVSGASGSAQGAAGQVDAAIAALESMTTGKDDPGYGAVASALTAARQATGSVASTLANVEPTLTGAAGVSKAAADQVAQLSTGLQQLYAGSTELQGGLARLRKGNADLAGGIQRLSSGGGQLTAGLGQLTDGAAALETGLGQLQGGAGQLQSGLSGGTGPAGQLSGGLGKLEAGVAKFRGALPSTEDLEQLQKQSPGLFDSGYFVLAAIQGAHAADRAVASFAVNVDRGGTAGQIVVVPAQAANTDATRQLGEDLRAWSQTLAADTRTETAVGGPAGNLTDFAGETQARIPLVVVGIALGVALVLMIALRTVLLPLVVVLFDLLTALATFGALALLFGGDDPVLGGPGYLDPMSVIGIFAAIFGISIVYQVLLLLRARERFVATDDEREALTFALRRTAAVATGAAAAMVAVALPFAFSELINVRQFGVGLAIAVALDALVVRPVLLPAAVAVLGRSSWWPAGRDQERAARSRLRTSLRKPSARV